MRLLALAGAFGLAIVAASQLATPADAGPFGPRFCAQYAAAARTAASTPFNQCLAAISGVGGILHRRADPDPGASTCLTARAASCASIATRSTESYAARRQAKKPGIAAGLLRFRLLSGSLRLLDRREQPVAARARA